MIPAPVGHHCPDCVAEAKREFRLGPRRQVRSLFGTSATQLLLLAIIAMFAIEVIVSHGRALANGVPNKTAFDLGALFPPAIAQGGQYWRLITVMFLHANLLHIALNGYALWLFGRFVEDTFGRVRFLAIYFVTGFLAAATSYTFGPVAQLGVGASGAIVGLLGAFIAYNFRRRHMTLARGNLRWALMIIALNVLIGSAFNGIDNWAHGGGLVAGLLAGTIAEGFGPKEMRPAVRVLGFLALIALGVVMVVLRTQALRSA
jgi:membrane associated rhomboid family serine protease